MSSVDAFSFHKIEQHSDVLLLASLLILYLQHYLSTGEKIYLSRIVGVKKTDKKRMGELRVEVGGVKERFKKKLTRNRLKWTGHVERKRYDK